MGKYSNPRRNNKQEQEQDLDLIFDDQDFEEFYAPPPPSRVSHSAPRQSRPAKGQTRRKILVASLCICTLVLLAAIGGTLWLTLGEGADDGLILPNVSIGGVELGGLTPQEATSLLELATGHTYTEQNMVIHLPDGETLTLSPGDTGAKLDLETAVQAAYDYGRSGSRAENEQTRLNAQTQPHTIAMLPYLNLNLDYIRGALEDYCEGFNSDFAQSSITLEGEMPVLNTGDESFDPDAPCQTLVLNMGMPGRHVDFEKLYNSVLDAYSFNTFEVTVDVSEGDTDPEPLAKDLLDAYEQYTQEPVDAMMDMETFDVSHEVYGYTFDLDAALQQVASAAYGDTLEIPFSFVVPEQNKEALEAVLFRDVLASYETKHTKNENRNTNLTLACAAINGHILQPGDKFDYNTVVGKRTAEKGYKAADAYEGGQTVKTLGGGICQVSSTLYYCTLIADLEIVTRLEHSYTSSYMPLGMDATVSWGGPHFAFRNNTNYPIRIEAEVSGGYVRIKLIGTDEKDYYVKMEYEVLSNSYATTVYEEYTADNPEGYKDGEVITTAYNGCTVQTYKLKYDKETDQLISREKEALSKYKKRDKVICKIVSSTEPTDAPTDAPTEAPTDAPTEAPTTPPTEAPTTPPTEAPTTPPAEEEAVG